MSHFLCTHHMRSQAYTQNATHRCVGTWQTSDSTHISDRITWFNVFVIALVTIASVYLSLSPCFVWHRQDYV